jgi:hypothetical protein
MFIITGYTTATPYRVGVTHLRDVGDIVVGITGKEEDRLKAIIIASEMGNGGIYTANWYRIERVEKKERSVVK